jgi:hypothetical protein
VSATVSATVSVTVLLTSEVKAPVALRTGGRENSRAPAFARVCKLQQRNGSVNTAQASGLYQDTSKPARTVHLEQSTSTAMRSSVGCHAVFN